MYKISIVVPVYNAQEYLHCCLDSILAQTFKDFELLIIDDGSTDNSLAICKQYMTDYRVHVVHQANSGVSVARNRGIEMAKGEWIMFIDSDDDVEPEMLSMMYATITSYPSLDLIIGGYNTLIWSNDEIVRRCLHTHSSKYFCNRQSLANYAIKYIDLLCGPCCKLFKKSILKEHYILFPVNMSNGEDTVFVFHYLNYINSAYILNAACYNYHIRETKSLSSQFNEDRIKTCIDCNYIIADFLKFNGVISAYSDPMYLVRVGYVGYLGAIYLHKNKLCYKERRLLLQKVNDFPGIKAAFSLSYNLSIKHRLIGFMVLHNLYFLEDSFFCVIEFIRKFPIILNLFRRIT